MVETKTPGKYGELWSREELILAFGLYCRRLSQRGDGGSRALFLLALRNVAEAHGGMAAVSERPG
jgi:hypothetical protein